MSAPSNSTATPARGVSLIAARLVPPPGRHHVDPRNPNQWRASQLVGDRNVKVVER